MTEEPVAAEQSPKPQLTKEIQIGGGDPIRINSFCEIIQEGLYMDTQAVMKDLPSEALNEATEQIASLPFRFGSTEHIGTLQRPVHDADVTLSSRGVAYDAPESEKAKQRLAFIFGPNSGVLSLDTHNNLSVGQGPSGENKDATIVRFAPESPLKIAGREIGEVTLVIPRAPSK